MNRTRLLIILPLLIVNVFLIADNIWVSKQRDDAIKLAKTELNAVTNLTSHVQAIYVMGWDRGVADLYYLVQYTQEHAGEPNNVSNTMAIFKLLEAQAKTNINVTWKK
jgi:hypothetical protein